MNDAIFMLTDLACHHHALLDVKNELAGKILTIIIIGDKAWRVTSWSFNKAVEIEWYPETVALGIGKNIHMNVW